MFKLISMLDYKDAIKQLEAKYSEDQIEEIFDNFHDSAFKKEIVEVDGLSMIVDGMNGKYIFFGKVFTKSEVYQPLDSFLFPKISTKVKKLGLFAKSGWNFHLKS